MELLLYRRSNLVDMVQYICHTQRHKYASYFFSNASIDQLKVTNA
jgi:hypothetical protein